VQVTGAGEELESDIKKEANFYRYQKCIKFFAHHTLSYFFKIRLIRSNLKTFVKEKTLEKVFFSRPFVDKIDFHLPVLFSKRGWHPQPIHCQPDAVL
jgi:hypothetical protein